MMKTNKSKVQFFNMIVWICVLTIASCDQKSEHKLPIYGQRSVTQKEVNGKIVVDTIYHQIPDFNFINQDSSSVNQDFFNQKIYIANFFFTRCPTICPIMQRNMLTIYNKYLNDERVAFLSHSIDYRNDIPWVLKEYADRLGVDNSKWQFVNGQKDEISGISKEYLVFTTEDEDAPGGYDHQGFFILVDKKKRIRGAYDGTEIEQVNKLVHDIEVLIQEKE